MSAYFAKIEPSNLQVEKCYFHLIIANRITKAKEQLFQKRDETHLINAQFDSKYDWQIENHYQEALQFLFSKG